MLLFATFYSKANSLDSLKIVNFRVVNSLSGKPVELAHVVNRTQRVAAIADLLGYFKIPVNIGDTISISSLGYYNQSLYNWGQFGKDSTFYTIRLKPRTYEIKELKFSWFSTYDKFLKGFLQLQIPMNKDDEKIARITEYFKRSISKLDLMDMPQVTSGAMFGKDWLSKQNEKFVKRLEKERQQRAIERKYSAGIVEALTGLKGNEVFWFMEYCAFTDEYLLRASDYDIRLSILDKFKIYNQDKTVSKPK